MSSHSTTNTVTRRNGVEIPDNLKPFFDSILNSTKNLNQDLTNNEVFKNLYNTAMGNNLNYINPYEQKQLNSNIDNTNNAIMRQFDASGRGNSFSNLQAITGNTDKLTQGFMANNLNRNRQAMNNAQNLYFNQLNQGTRNQLDANNLLSNLIRNFSTTINSNSQTNPGRSWWENGASILGGLLGRFGG